MPQPDRHGKLKDTDPDGVDTGQETEGVRRHQKREPDVDAQGYREDAISQQQLPKSKLMLRSKPRCNAKEDSTSDDIEAK